jgi:hypothetical protein
LRKVSLVLVLVTSLAAGVASAKVPDPKKAAAVKKPAPVAKKPGGKPAGPEAKAPEKPTKSIADTTPAEAASAPTPAATEEGKTLQRGERIEFDARLIQGQTAKAGAVYLFERVQTPLRSMVKERTSFRDKVVRKVFPDEEGAH